MSDVSKGIALVTGSAQGIGYSIALRLARDGFDVALNDIPSKYEQLRAVAVDIEKIGRRTLLVPADVAVDAEVRGMVEKVVIELGGLDVMVANAGVTNGIKSLLAVDVEDWERVMAVNGRGTFLCYKYAAQQMVKQGRGGRIIGASSGTGRQGKGLLPAYSASKFAIRGLTHAAALELGKYKITVNAYAPGAINTEMSAEIFVDNFTDPILEEVQRKRVSTRALLYEGQPDDIASAVSYLASKESHFITGQTITVDGGIILS